MLQYYILLHCYTLLYYNIIYYYILYYTIYCYIFCYNIIYCYILLLQYYILVYYFKDRPKNQAERDKETALYVRNGKILRGHKSLYKKTKCSPLCGSQNFTSAITSDTQSVRGKITNTTVKRKKL